MICLTVTDIDIRIYLYYLQEDSVDYSSIKAELLIKQAMFLVLKRKEGLH